MALIEAVAAVLSKYMTIWPRYCWRLIHVLMIGGFRMFRAIFDCLCDKLREQLQRNAFSCFNGTAGGSLTRTAQSWTIETLFVIAK